MSARFAVIVPTYGEWPYVLRCLHTLVKNTTDYKCFVLDDASPDWEPEIESEIRRIVPAEHLYFERFSTNRGLTAAWNYGLQLAQDHQIPYAALVNSDTLFTPGWAPRTIRALGRSDLVGPVTNAPSLSYEQDVRKYRRFYRLDDSHDALVDLSNFLRRKYNDKQRSGAVNGFWMAAKTAIWWANAFDSDHVFNPANRLTNNENEFQKRFKGRIATMLDVFIFHYRSVSRGLENVNPEFCKGHFRIPGHSSAPTPIESDDFRKSPLAQMLPTGMKKLLHVGCRTGAIGAALKQRESMRVVGIEPDPTLAAISSANIDLVHCRSAEEASLEFLDQTEPIDALLFDDVLQTFRDPSAVLARFTTLLQPGGRVIISLPNVGHCTVIWNLLWKRYWPQRDRGVQDRTHLRWFTKRNIEELLEFANLQPIAWRESHRIADSPGDWNARWGSLFARGPLRKLLTYQYFVLAQKM